jgi:hypothetical protein
MSIPDCPTSIFEQAEQEHLQFFVSTQFLSCKESLISTKVKHNCRGFLGTVAVSIVCFGTVLVPLPLFEEAIIHTTLRYLTTMTDHSPFLASASAQSAKDIHGPSPLLTIENESPAKLIVDPPLPEPLAQGRVFIQYRTEHLRLLPVFGKGALEVSPRIGHIHITVDDAPWHFVDASGDTIILVGLEPGSHKVRIDLADPTHKVITSRMVTFTLPDPK